MSIRAWLFGPASILLALAVVAGAFVVFGSTDSPVEAADHRDSITPQTDPFADINDVYVFNDRGGAAAADRVTLVMTVNPHAKGLAPSQPFSNSVKYNLHADLNADNVADATITFSFTGSGSTQNFYISGLSANNTYLTGVINQITNFPNATVTGFVGPADVFCGFRDDPFFFDLSGFQQFLAGSYNYAGGASGLRNPAGATPTPSNNFAQQNVSAIVIELPDSTFGSTTASFRAWATTTR